MDDLELLRDLGRELEHEPPASLARQRGRLGDAARGRRGGWRMPGRWALFGAVAAVTAALVLVPAVLRGVVRDGPARALTQGRGKAMNVLLLGSDARRGGPARADTLVLVHLPADRKDVRAVSVPRDLMVRITRCGTSEPGEAQMINKAFAMGGAACAEATVESALAVKVDTTVVVEFAGFMRMVDALGGVEMTLNEGVISPEVGLRLGPGRHRLDGRQALAYARVRHGLDNGSDLSRIVRQQRVMSALVRRARELQRSDPIRYAKFVMVAAQSVSTRPRLDLGALQALSRSMERTGPEAVRFSTLPVRPAPADPNRVALDGAAARQILAPFRER